MENVTMKDIKASDKNFGLYKSESIGTESVWVLSPFVGKKLVITDGVKALFDEKQCFWLGDVIASYVPSYLENGDDFLLIRVAKDLEGSGCTFVIHDDGEGILINQSIPYTDLDINVKLYLINDGVRYTVLCPEEY